MSGLRERNKERLRKSIAGDMPDAHACFNFYTYPFFHEVTKVPLNEYFHNPRTMLESQLEVYEQLEKCGDFAPDLGSVPESSCLGGPVRFDDKGFISVHELGINDIDDVIKLKPGDPYGGSYMTRVLETLEYMVEHAPKGYKVNPPALMGPFTVAAQLRGIGDFCADTICEPELVDALLEIVIETQVNYLKAQEKILGKLDHVLVCDDLAAFLSEEDYRRLIIPTYDKVFGHFPDTQRWYHNDADAKHLITAVSDAGMAAWQYGPSVDPIIGVTGTQGKVTMLGGIMPTDFARYSVDETIEVCNRLIDTFGGNPKFVLSAGGSINQTPIENLLAMFHVADERKIK